ncbi:hypothetical protein Tco_0626567 [Tanacetum coccineum]|uniref:Uncharacterized protein n=1 Tax=Tanacetum coccineum TaxID=301880 RepID=A0ABQ4WJZ5_9ASTR
MSTPTPWDRMSTPTQWDRMSTPTQWDRMGTHTQCDMLCGTLRVSLVAYSAKPECVGYGTMGSDGYAYPVCECVDLILLHASIGECEEDKEINSLIKEPVDTLLLGDEVITTTPARENDKFIKSSVDDLVLIPRESEVTLVCNDFECNMPVNTPFPTTDVMEEYFDINSPLGEQVVDFLMDNEDVAIFPSIVCSSIPWTIKNTKNETLSE